MSETGRNNLNSYDCLAEYYDATHNDRAPEIAFLSPFARRATRIIDFACGSGTLAAPLRDIQVESPLNGNKTEMMGVDISPAMLRIAKARGQPINWQWGDIRTFRSRQTYDLALCCFNSVQHLLTEGDLDAAFRTFRISLQPGGTLVLDLFNPNPDFLVAKRQNVFLKKVELPGTGRWLDLYEDTSYDEEASLLALRWTLVDPLSGEKIGLGNFSMRQIYPRELGSLLARNHFAVDELYGDFDGSGFHAGAPKQILVARAL